MYNDEGESVWEQELDMYGNVRKFANKDYVHLPFRYQGQYYDKEIELCYNRFRYYDPEIGRYISEDPIGFASGEYNFYNYADDPNAWVDVFGLTISYGTSRGQKKSDPNSIYVQKDAKGDIKSIYYYDSEGNVFSKEDYKQKADHKIFVDDKKYNLKNHPHEHQARIIEGPNGPYYKKQVRILDSDGKPISSWVNEGK